MFKYWKVTYTVKDKNYDYCDHAYCDYYDYCDHAYCDYYDYCDHAYVKFSVTRKCQF